MKIKTDILVVHPFKHHAFHLAAGCIKSGRATKAVFPLYAKGFGALIQKIPGRIGRRASLYKHESLPNESVYSPINLQLGKLLSFLGDPGLFQYKFDEYVCEKIKGGEWTANVLIALQDHMPKSIFMAKKKGFKIWSDQINYSYEATERLECRRRENGLNIHGRDESNNIDILNLADIVTAPSSYALEMIADLARAAENIKIIPYGVDSGRFYPSTTKGEFLQFFVRANTIEKGGDMFLRALAICGPKLLETLQVSELSVFILGNLDNHVSDLLVRLDFDSRIKISNSALPSSDVPGYMRDSSLFIMPSCSESMSLACIEAMQCGLPLLVSKFVGLDDFSKYEIGLQVDLSVESLIDGLIKICQLRSKWGEFSSGSLEYAKSLSWVKYENLVSELALKV